MRYFFAISLSFLFLLPLKAQEPTFSSEVVDGVKVLRHEVVVEASLTAVWDLFTTEAGVRSWITPVAFVDFREGGFMEASYDHKAKKGDPKNIKSQFTHIAHLVKYTSKTVQVPPDFPNRQVLLEISGEVSFHEVAPGKVKVSIAMLGWKDTPEHTKVHQFFEQGNTWYCHQLLKRLKEGPFSWETAKGE